MKVSRIFMLAFFLQLLALTGYSQQVVLVSGDPSILQGETRLGLLYNYDNMKVGKMSEEDYISKKIAEYNQKTPGKGDEWSKSWKADRDSRFQPRFEDLLNKYLKEKGVSASSEIKDSKYSILLKTTFTEPGYNIYVSSQNAMIDVEIYIVETANPSNVLVKLTIKRIPGRTAMGYDYDTGGRIEEAYAKCGKNLGIYLQKKVFKGK
jgi:hypothetical protein